MPIAVALGARAGWRSTTGLPSIRTSPVTPRSTPNSASSSSRWPWPSRPPRPTTSPARDATARCRAAGRSRTGCGTSSTGGASLGIGVRLRRKDVAVFAADHQLDDLVVGLGAGLVGRDVAAVAEHRALVGELGDLVHAVRDVEQRQALRAQPLQHGEDLGDVGGGQRRGRLVEDQDARLARQRLGDLDHLPARQRQVLDQRQRMDVLGAGARQRLLGDAALRARGRSGRSAVGGLRDDDVVGDRLRSGISDSSWKMQTMPAALAAAGEAKRDLAARRASCGLRRAATTPAMILISVDLPAPFSPRMAWMRPALDRRARPSPARARRHSAWTRPPCGRADAGLASIGPLPGRRRSQETAPRGSARGAERSSQITGFPWSVP